MKLFYSKIFFSKYKLIMDSIMIIFLHRNIFLYIYLYVNDFKQQKYLFIIKLKMDPFFNLNKLYVIKIRIYL